MYGHAYINKRGICLNKIKNQKSSQNLDFKKPKYINKEYFRVLVLFWLLFASRLHNFFQFGYKYFGLSHQFKRFVKTDGFLLYISGTSPHLMNFELFGT